MKSARRASSITALAALCLTCQKSASTGLVLAGMVSRSPRLSFDERRTAVAVNARIGDWVDAWPCSLVRTSRALPYGWSSSFDFLILPIGVKSAPGMTGLMPCNATASLCDKDSVVCSTIKPYRM
jgi:hypothetical protein